ncbi:MAG: SRPBCC family protein [Blastocatellia bacterium]
MFNKKERKRLFDRLAKRPLKQRVKTRVKTWMLTSMLIGGLARLRSKARFIPGLRARKRQPINTAYGLCAAAGAGAGLMYLLDPNQGGLRRSSLTGGASRAAHTTGSAIGGASRDLFNRARGLVAGAESRFSGDNANDRNVIKLIRSEIGRLVSHPRAIQVASHDGRVAITGHILARELDELITRIRSLRGVIEVDNRLHTHERDEDIHHHLHLLGGHLSGFSPVARTLTALAGGALIGAGLRRRGVLGAGLGALGFGLVARGLTNIGVKRLIGNRHAIDFHRTINLDAPIERVFEFWANHDNFPHFLSNVREVRHVGDGRSQWTVFGPAGVPVKWNARITEFIPNKLIAWKSEPGSAIAHAGIVRLDANKDGSTRATIKMSFHPQTGAVGQAVETIFGDNPKREIEEGLRRVKAIIETGRAPRAAAQTWSSMREATAD